jgi:transposase-like protein
MVLEDRGEHPSLWAAIESIAGKTGCVPQTGNAWVRQHEVDAGQREGVSTT